MLASCISPSYCIANNSTSKYNVAPPGITPPAPLSPYPKRGGMIICRRSPTAMVLNDSSHPRMTWPLPTEKEKGLPRSRLESNFFGESKPSNQPIRKAIFENEAKETSEVSQAVSPTSIVRFHSLSWLGNSTSSFFENFVLQA